MKTFFKSIVIVIGLLLIATTLGTFFLGGSLKGMTKKTMEQMLTRAFGSKATVDRVSISPISQTVELYGVKIENPETFAEGAAMHFDKILVKLDAKTLLTDTPTIPKVTIDGAELNLSLELGRGFNFDALANKAKEVKGAMGTIDPGKKSTDASKTEVASESASPAIRLEELQVEKSHLNVSSSLLPEKQVKLDIEPFSIKGTAGDQSPTPGRIAALFIESLMQQVKTNELLSPLHEFMGGGKPAPAIESLEPVDPEDIPESLKPGLENTDPKTAAPAETVN
jgi:uncharacterized protein involved in outer membrane biogenesis